jgi:hypothetical protein
MPNRKGGYAHGWRGLQIYAALEAGDDLGARFRFWI